MKVLCPIDFSKASVNASIWITKYLDKQGEGEIHLLHCISIRGRATMFLKIDDILTERAHEDMDELKKKLSTLTDNVKISSSIFVHDAKEYIPSFASSNGFDLVVTGTKGLTALKNITVGSVTETIIQKAVIPVLTIPSGNKYHGVRSIVIGVDDKLVINEEVVAPLVKICKDNDSELKMVHVKRSGDDFLEYDPSLDLYFRNLNYSYDSIDYDDSIAESLTEYCDDEDADMLCMIHRKKTWFGKLFHRSVTKSELFDLEIPLLVLPHKVIA